MPQGEPFARFVPSVYRSILIHVGSLTVQRLDSARIVQEPRSAGPRAILVQARQEMPWKFADPGRQRLCARRLGPSSCPRSPSRCRSDKPPMTAAHTTLEQKRHRSYAAPYKASDFRLFPIHDRFISHALFTTKPKSLDHVPTQHLSPGSICSSPTLYPSLASLLTRIMSTRHQNSARFRSSSGLRPCSPPSE